MGNQPTRPTETPAATPEPQPTPDPAAPPTPNSTPPASSPPAPAATPTPDPEPTIKDLMGRVDRLEETILGRLPERQPETAATPEPPELVTPAARDAADLAPATTDPGQPADPARTAGSTSATPADAGNGGKEPDAGPTAAPPEATTEPTPAGRQKRSVLRSKRR